MKKQLTVALGLAVLATPALASKARLQALGESTNGSFFIQDNRNIFLNAAEVTKHGDLVTFEFGSSQTTDSDTDPNAEGGILFNRNNLVYGVHLGRVTSFDATTEQFGGVTGAESVYRPTNAIDLFIGGDAGFKWGANLTYAKSQDDTFTPDDGTAANTVEGEAQTLDLNLGVEMGNISAYVKAGILGNSEHKSPEAAAVAAEVDRKSEYEVGASYKLSDYTIFGQANMSEYDVEAGGADANFESTFYTLGAARTERLSDRTMAFVKLSYTHLNTEGIGVNGGSVDKNEVKTTAIPLSIGLEHDATSWLIVRGSVSQNLWSNQDDDATGERTIASTTNVNAGASLKFGDLVVDGVVGTGTDGAGNITDTESERGVLSLSNLMTRASITYNF